MSRLCLCLRTFHTFLTDARLTEYVGRMLSESDANLPLIGVQDVNEHLRRRRPWNRAFSAAAVKGYEETIARRARQLVDALERQQEEGEVVLGKWFNFFA